MTAATDVPACPRCADGGTVVIINSQQDASVFYPLPQRPNVIVYQCSVCGWATAVRREPERQEPSHSNWPALTWRGHGRDGLAVRTGTAAVRTILPWRARHSGCICCPSFLRVRYPPNGRTPARPVAVFFCAFQARRLQIAAEPLVGPGGLDGNSCRLTPASSASVDNLNDYRRTRVFCCA